MTAPSSPVPAVERIELPGGWYFQQLNPPHGVIYALRTPKGQGFGINGTGMSVGLPVVQAFAAALTPTPGRAAEPDTMVEVDFLALLAVFGNAAYTGGEMRSGEPEAEEEELEKALAASAALLSAYRTIVTDRDEWKANYESLFESRDLRVAALATRAETAEAQLATLRAEVEGLRKLSDTATDGPWHVTTEDVDGNYGSGPGCGTGWKGYAIRTEAQQAHGKDAAVFDTINSDVGEIHEESDEDGVYAWDEPARANAEYVAALVNWHRTLLSTSGANQ